ncbi:metallophosphoesterase family protein [Pectobacterium cacticida]|uniref:metallophosphoesterase family protein n=1 Tax=Pectobacterium cacticida TaxID=69221 RepID=UPI002FF2BE28
MKRRAFIKSAALLSMTSIAPAYSRVTETIESVNKNNRSQCEPIALISDLHIDNDEMIKNLYIALNNIKRNGIKNIIIPGDLAEDLPYIRKIFTTLSQVYPEKDGNNVVAILGNHDVRGLNRAQWTTNPLSENHYFTQAIAEYKLLNSPFAHHVNDHACFDIRIGEHHLIALNTDRGLKDQAWFEPTTLAWLEARMAEKVSGKRIIIVHQSLNDTHWRANLYGGFGEQDGEIKSLLKKYPQTLVITGHIHNGFGVVEAIQREYGTLIEIPSFHRTENGLMEKGYGFILYLEDHAIRFEAWNFLTNTHYPEYDIYIHQQAIATVLKNSESRYDIANEQYPWQEIAQKYGGGDDITLGPEYFGIRKLWPAWRWEQAKQEFHGS